MLRFAKNPDAAAAAGAKAYDGYCVVTARHRDNLGFYGPLDGAHVFSRKAFPELACAPLNVLPVCRYRHNNPFGFESHDNIGCMDLVGASPRPHIDRVAWLLRHANGEYRRRVWEQVSELVYEALLISERVRGYEDDLTVMLGER